MRNQYILLMGLWLGALGAATAQNYPALERFGKNRIQYRSFDWKIIRTSNFEIYYYQDGTQIANLTAQYAESEFDRITELLGYTPYNRVKIFLFNSPSELAQSNIGLNTQGSLNKREQNLSKSRIELAFTGDQISFRRQIVHDVSMLFVYDMLYGGSLKDALQSSLLLTLPEWFMPGIASYIADGYSLELDDYMRDASLTRTIKKPSLLAGAEAERVGHSIWNYIVQKYGRDNVSNILNLTRIIRNEQSSISSTLGIPYSRFLREWRDYYAGMANAVTQAYRPSSDEFQIKIKSSSDEELVLNSLKLSPDKQYFAYTTLFDGKYKVEVVNTTNQKRTKVLQGGYRLDGQEARTRTPLISWQRGNNLVIITDELGKTNLYQYSDFEKKPKRQFKRQINGLTQVLSMDASDDGGSLILSADRRGQNDLFIYSINRGSYQQITNDLYDDLYPQFVGRTARQVVFSSNRKQDTLGVDKGSYKTITDRLSLFSHEGSARDFSLVRLTDSLSHATQPIPASETVVYFLNDVSGIRNLYRLDTESGSVGQVTAFPESIRFYDLNPSNGGFVYSSLKNGEEYIGFRSQINLTQTVQAPPTQRSISSGSVKPARATTNRSNTVKTDSAGQVSRADTTRPDTVAAKQTVNANRLALEPGEVDTDNYQFDPDVLKSTEYRQRRTIGGTAPTLTTTLPRNRRRENITIRGPFNYKGLFTVSDANSNWRIDPISAKGFGYSQDVTLTDLLENHVLRAGLFITTTLRNSDLFAEYTNLKHLIDFGARVDRSTLFVDNSGLSQKYRYNRVALSASYPLSVTTRFTVSPFYATTRLIDVSSFSEPDRVSDYGGVRGEIVFDNTKVNGMNLAVGTKMKIKYEEYAGLRSSSESFRRLSLDLRHYQKIHRDLVLAARFSFSQSGGPAPKQSTLGGMDNWIGTNSSIKELVASNPLLVPNTIPAEIPYDYRNVFFLDFAAPLRGFRQGKLTGTSHMLLNVELRLPLIRYLYRGNITSNFLRNLQLVAFTDIGTAWSGKGPFSQQNSLNTEVVGGGNTPFRAVVTNFKNPFLIGYGAGARTMLFGYFVKFDYGWGLENKVVSKPIAYLTLGYDF
ncbi:hypothetical protein M0L20_05205 [Spirosoma sp. RP8]|uniref:Translocation protein TolB n=1 Tax=Spirosoma liriopis TaxID=2937440 RepID=A0ABT0HI48_9BACT|nr:hypothetical protein [Spirosoma liriopis]MCK8491240.1 hypothetical protein [Spirosoma liriopis]